MLDTSAWVDVFRGRTPELLAACRDLLTRDRVLTCSPVVFELRRGLGRRNRKAVLQLIDAVPRFPVTEEDWDAAGDLDGQLRRKGVTIPPIDVLIAQVCLRHGVPLLAVDRHFEKVPGLKLHVPSR